MTKTSISFEVDFEVEASFGDGDLESVWPTRLGVIHFEPGKGHVTSWLPVLPGETAEDFLTRVLKLVENEAVQAVVQEAAEDNAAQLDAHRERKEELRRWPD